MGASKFLHRILKFINYANLSKFIPKSRRKKPAFLYSRKLTPFHRSALPSGDVYYASHNLLIHLCFITSSYKKVTCHQRITNLTTVYVVIFAVVLFSWICEFRVRPREHFHFNVCLFIVMKTSENREIKLSRISPRSQKSRKYLCAKYMAYTVIYLTLSM